MNIKNQFSDWHKGFQVACAEYLSGDVYDVPASINSFRQDRPDTDFQRGYLAGLLSTAHAITEGEQAA